MLLILPHHLFTLPQWMTEAVAKYLNRSIYQATTFNNLVQLKDILLLLCFSILMKVLVPYLPGSQCCSCHRVQQNRLSSFLWRSLGQFPFGKEVALCMSTWGALPAYPWKSPCASLHCAIQNSLQQNVPPPVAPPAEASQDFQAALLTTRLPAPLKWKPKGTA